MILTMFYIIPSQKRLWHSMWVAVLYLKERKNKGMLYVYILSISMQCKYVSNWEEDNVVNHDMNLSLSSLMLDDINC